MNQVWIGDFGDGTVVAGTLTEENEQPDTTGTSTAEHAYSEPGDYTVALDVTDDDSGIGTDTSTGAITTAEEAIPVVDEYIHDLPDGTFKNNAGQRKNAFLEKLGYHLFLFLCFTALLLYCDESPTVVKNLSESVNILGFGIYKKEKDRISR